MDWKTHTGENCLNCNTKLQGKFCSACGQSANVGRITFKETFIQFLNSAFSLESNLWKTVQSLVRNPGNVFREFIAGKRKSYYQPVSFFLVMTAIYVIVRLMIGYDPLEDQKQNLESAPDETLQASRFLVKNINYIMIFLAFSSFSWRKS